MKVRLGHRDLLAFLVALTPLLFNYYLFVEQVLISDLIILLSAFLAVITGHLKINRYFFYGIFVFFAYVVLNQIRTNLSGAINPGFSGFLIPARLLFYYLAAVVVGRYLGGRPEVENVVVTVALVSAAYSVFQLCVYYTTGTALLTGIPFLPQRFGLELFENSVEIFRSTGYRPTSFFIEPAHLAQYCMVGCLVLVMRGTQQGNENHGSFLKSKMLLLVIAPMAAGSGTAVVTLIFLFLLSIRGSGNRGPFRRIGGLRGAVLPYLFACIFAIALAIEATAISRINLQSFAVLLSADSSALFVRVIRPFVYLTAVLEDGDLFHALFGFGFGSYEAALQANGLTTAYEDYAEMYWINTFGVILASAGLLGFLAFVSIFVALWIVYRKARVLSAYLFLSLFFSDMPASAFAFLVLVLIFSGAHRPVLNQSASKHAVKSGGPSMRDSMGTVLGSAV